MHNQRLLSIQNTGIACMASLMLCTSGTALAAEWCENHVTDNDRRIVQRIEKPAPRQSYTDPAFGTRVTRVTDAATGTARRTLYSTMQPWNADESFLILYHAGGDDAGHHLYDGRTYRYIRQLEFSPDDIEGVYWDPVDPEVLFFVQRRPLNDPMMGNLVRYNVVNSTRTQVADLNAVCGDPATRGGRVATGGSDIQGLGNDLMGLRCQNNSVNGDSSDVTFTVNVRTGNISDFVTLDPAKPQGSNAFGFSPFIAAAPLASGQNVLVQNTVFDRNMNQLYTIDSAFYQYRAQNGLSYRVPKPEHSSTGRMPSGNDALFSPQYGPTEFGCGADSDSGQGALVAYDIPEQQCNVIVGRSTGWGYPLSGVHLSSVSQRNPGWVSMSSIGYGLFDYFSNAQPAPVFFSELSLSHADPDNPETCRLAHTRTYGKSATRGGDNLAPYFGEPHPVMSPSGSRILFNSDWYDSGSVDTYAVNLPESIVSPTPEPEPVLPVPTPEPAPTPEPEPTPVSPDNTSGYVFSRTDKQELRWITENSNGQQGSIWINQACAQRMGGVSATGDWNRLISVAPGFDTVANPCEQQPIEPDLSGYVYSRTDKNEIRWITTNSNGQQGSIWISSTCAGLLGGPTVSGDWTDLISRAPAFDSVVNPCR